MRKLFESVKVERLKVRVRIFVRGRKKKERRKRIVGIQSKERENHGDAKVRRYVFLRVSESPWFRELICIFLLFHHFSPCLDPCVAVGGDFIVRHGSRLVSHLRVLGENFG